MELSNRTQSSENHLNNESVGSGVQDIPMVSPARNGVMEQQRNNHRNRSGDRGNCYRGGRPFPYHQNTFANTVVPYNNNGGIQWFAQSTYVGGWNYAAAPHFMPPNFMPPPMRPDGFPASPAVIRPTQPPPQQQRHNPSVRNHRNYQNCVQNQHADSYVGGWDDRTTYPMIPLVNNQEFISPMVYYVPPNVGQQNMYGCERPPLPLPPPQQQTFGANHVHNKGLYWRIVNQVNYYFGDENLKGDVFLKSHMDADGWVPVKLIATFNRMRQLTDDIAFILFALHGSSIVEVSGDKIRRRRR